MKNLRYFPIVGAVTALMAGAMLSAQEAPIPGNPDADVQVLTRGPVHEAFAELVSLEAEAGIVVKTAPPELIEELAPEHQLEGDNVEWIPGYWGWDEERNEFIWISGIWRNLPPGRQWVPGYWSEVGGGEYQWTSGYWSDSEVEETSYLSTAPPRNLDVGPNVEAPSENHNWVPGNWIWAEQRYVWRPGYWVGFRQDWTWVPSRYCWTRRGYVFVDGYWDYALPRRGVLFAPVYFDHHVYARPNHYYTPSVVVALDVFAHHLFARPRYCHYYFGDYYSPRYRTDGYYASFSWHSYRGGYDPIYAYDRWHHRRDRDWERRRHRDFDYFRDHEDARPPRTWAAMRDFREERFNDGRTRRFASTLDDFARNETQGLKFRRLDANRREKAVVKSREMRNFGGERRRLEVAGRVRDRDSAKMGDVRAKFSRSPIAGRKADRLSKSASPPKRPEVRGADLRIKAEDVKTPGRKSIRQETGRRADAGKQGKLQAQVRSAPERKGQVAPQRKTEQAQVRRGFERKTQVAPQRKAEQQAQTRRTPERKAQVAPQRKAEQQAQVRRAPERKAQTAPQRKAQQQAQVRRAPERKAQTAPQRKAQQQAQVRRAPERKAQVAPQRKAQQQAQVRRAPERKAQMAPHRKAQQQAQVRRAPERKAQVAPQRKAQQQAQVRRAPERKAQVAPQRRTQSAATNSRRQSSDEEGRRGGR